MQRNIVARLMWGKRKKKVDEMEEKFNFELRDIIYFAEPNV